MKKVSENEKLKNFLEQAYGKKLSNEEVKEHTEKITKLFGLFVQIDQKNKKGKKWK